MKSSSRWLVWFGIAIGVLVALTVVLVLVLPREAPLLPETTPEGVVQRFLLAVQQNDLRQAYGYLNIVEKGKKLTYEEWLPYFSPRFRPDQNSWKATIGETTINGNSATVEVIIDIFRARGPFENPVDTSRVGLELTRADGTWYITQRPPIWFIY